ncbi:MAG: L,D-transpeptidase family protein [Planctomycetes bacterium]|nr:L,D-transpeptidase family protein [Planctomycetota bacterium]
MLQSQTIRVVSHRSHMYRRHRSKRRLGVITGLLALVAAVWTGWMLLGSADATPRTPHTPHTPPTPPAPKAPTSAATSTPPVTRGNGVERRPHPEASLQPRAVAATLVALEVVDVGDGDRPVLGSSRTLQPARRAGQSDEPRQGPFATTEAVAGEMTTPPALATDARWADTDQPLEARRTLTEALWAGDLAPGQADRIRESASALNKRLVFGPEIVEGDPFVRSHIVLAGEQLARIVKAHSLAVDWRFIMRINGINDERRIRPGRRLKLITGPFHAIVSKSAFRLDLYLGSGPQRVYVASYPVGLGKHNSTPAGMFRVLAGSKLVNPAWTDPRTGKHFDPYDPNNPIGERWIGLQPLDEANHDLMGYGIHGTIEPESIGTQSSMGCIRMLPKDVEVIYEALVETLSTIEIRP